jgi:Domain of unknown function (DUF4294)
LGFLDEYPAILYVKSNIYFFRMKRLVLVVSMLVFALHLMAQTAVPTNNPNPMAGQILMQIEINGKDTMIVAELREIVVSAPRTFMDAEQYRQYLYYRKCAGIVYPYAIEAVGLYRQLQDETQGMKSGDRKDKIKDLQKDLKGKFEDKLKNLTRIQGKILIKMIEKDLGISFFDLLKDLRGGFTAFYWNEFSKIYGYHLKDGYTEGEDAMLDLILKDFDLSKGLH